MRGHILGVIGVFLAVAAVTANAEPAKPETEVFFKFDSSQLSREAKDELRAAAKHAKASPNAKIVIDGHTDPVGTSAYNVGLSIRRAEAARDFLICKGVDKDNIVMAYYGEDGKLRATHVQDRRVSVELPGTINAELDASTGDGAIQAGDFGLQTDNDSKHELRGRLGSGGSTLKVRTGDGGITIAKK